MSAKKANAATRAARNERSRRPFDAALWSRATELAEQYQLMITRDGDVGFLGRTLEMPLVMADGRTAAACVAETVEATTLVIASMLERGETPPPPAAEGRRDVQLNVRLTALERSAIDAAAKREGFRSISDFVRSAALRVSGGRE